ncbi:MAG: radical SAM family heme chaperone HemW [Anaerolineales bacterium]
MDEVYALYLHIPFCRHRCAYCDFNTYAGQEESLSAYVAALCAEIQAAAGSSRLRVATIFFGGGTPSLLNPAHFGDIFRALRQSFEVLPEAEISMEANPGTVTRESLEQLRALGMNRLSFGVQSANPDELRLLERIHDYADVVNAVTWARQAGFENLNLDLIYGLPEQTLARWQQTLRLVTGLRPQHLSAYALTLEHGTPFGRWASRGLMATPDPDLAADMAEWAADFLAGQGYLQYEISNWAQPGRECRHNLQYWRNLPYLGLGAGAHGYAGGVRYANVLRIKTYIERMRSGAAGRRWPLTAAAVNALKIERDTEMDETLMTGLRLVREGVSEAAFAARFGVSLRAVYGREMDELLGLGLLEIVQTGGAQLLRLTRRGWLLGNQVFMRFLR